MNLGPREIVILLIVVLVLFGAKRLPDSARSLGLLLVAVGISITQ